MSKAMKKYISRGEGYMWQKESWRDSRIFLYYLGAEPDDVTIEEAQEIDFEKLLLRLDTGGSVFMTLKQEDEGLHGKIKVSNEWC